MTKLGRPVKITKNTIASKCLELYWKKGIQNVSYNAAIKYSGYSKGTVYNLFKNEDELHLNTLEYYYKNILVSLEYEILQQEDLFKFMEICFKKIMNTSCFFTISNSNRFLLGKQTKAYLKRLENKFKKLLSNLIVRHINKYKLNPNNLDISSLNIFVRHNITLLNILKYNNTKSLDLEVIKKSISEKILKSLHA